MTTATYDETDLKTLHANLEAKRTEVKDFRDKGITFEGEGTERKMIISSQDDIDSMRQSMKDADEIKGIIDSVEFSNGRDRYADGPAASASGEDAYAAHQRKQLEQLGGAQRKNLGEMFTDSPVFKEMHEKGLDNTPRPFKLAMKNIGGLMVARYVDTKDSGEMFERKDIYTAAGGTFTSPAFGTQENDGIVLPMYRTQTVRSLFPSDTTTSNLIEYVRRTGYVNNARVIAERTAADGTLATGGPTDVFGLKPPSNLTYTSESVPVRVIAHTIDVSKTVLDDEPRLQSTINGEMLYGLRLTEDAELLWGDGSAGHLQGLMTTEGIQIYNAATGPAGDYYSDSVRRALTLVQLAYYESTGVVLHPFDWEAMELEKDQFGRYVLVTNVAVGATKQVWQNPVVATPAMTHGTFLVGAFGLGAKLWDREEANIAISTETRDLFDRNAIAIRAEERLALEVPRPEAFVKGTFGAPSV
jgi:HK97 family phage major capsid protein